MEDRSIAKLLREAHRPLLSLELFPPKTHMGFAMLGSSIERMRSIQPDFVTVTYGAGGSTHIHSIEVCDTLHRMGFHSVMAHLTCVGASKDALRATAEQFYERGIRNVMALRGDPPKGTTEFKAVPDGLDFAGDLVTLLKEQHQDFCCGVAGYPETHPEATSPESDIQFLKRKVDMGASFITTQLFYDNELYFNYVDRCRAGGIDIPVIPGLMPPASLAQIERTLQLCSASFPKELHESMKVAGGSGPVAEAVGMAWTIKQIDELLEKGAPGIHLYILNSARTVLSPAIEDCLRRWR